MGNDDTIKAMVGLLGLLIERECECDKSRCREHFDYLAKLKYEYELLLMEHKDEREAI